MFANGKNPINVAKGWKGNAISEKKKNAVLKGIIEDLKNLPSKNRITEDIYEQISKEKLDASAEAPDPLEIQGPEKIRQIIHDNWISNEDIDPHAHQFTDETYNLAHLMKSYSEKLYELLYQSLYLPHPSKVESHFSKIVSNTKQQLIDKSNIQKNVLNYRTKNNLSDYEIDICLAIDACSFDRLHNKTKKYAFVFYIQPTNPSFKCLPIYFLPEKNGKANDMIIQVAKDIVEILEKNKLRVVSISTDGDNSYDKKAIESFELYRKALLEGGPNALENALNSIQNFNGTFWISDLLHILKCARSRILSKCICLRYQNFDHAFSVRFIQPILNLNKALTDLTSTGKMRDSYAKELFNITSLMKLINEGECEAAAYFLPYSVWAEAVFNEGLDSESRIYLLSIAFYAFYAFYIQSFEKKNGYIYDRNVEESLALTFAERNTIIRCMNTVIFQIHSIKKAIAQQSSIGLDRLGTHCLENFFGNVRNLCKNFDSYENILSNVAHSIISNNFLYDVGMISRNKKRLNEGGARIYPSLDEQRVRISTYFHPTDMAGIVLNYAGIPFSNYIEEGKIFTEDEVDAALDNISLWWCQIPKRKYNKNHSDVSSVKIPARCIALSKAGKSAGLLEPDQSIQTQKTAQEIISEQKAAQELISEQKARDWSNCMNSPTLCFGTTAQPTTPFVYNNYILNIYWQQYFQPKLFALSKVNPYAIQRFIAKNWK